MVLVVQDASEESLPATPSQNSSTAQPQDSGHDSVAGQRVPFQDHVPPGAEGLEQMLAAVYPPARQTVPLAQIPLHEQLPQSSRLIVAPPVQQQQSQSARQQQEDEQEQSRPVIPSHTGFIVNLMHPSEQQGSSQQAQTREPAGGQIPPGSHQSGAHVSPRRNQPGQVFNPQTGQVICQETGQDTPAEPRQVQTGQVIPQGAGQIVSSSEEQTGQELISVDISQPPIRANQEEDTNIVSSTLSAEGVEASKAGKSGWKVAAKREEPTKRELKYKKKYQASLIDNAKVTFELLERERQLKMSEQEIEDLRKRVREMENLLEWEKRLGEVQSGFEDTDNKRRGTAFNSLVMT